MKKNKADTQVKPCSVQHKSTRDLGLAARLTRTNCPSACAPWGAAEDTRSPSPFLIA